MGALWEHYGTTMGAPKFFSTQNLSRPLITVQL